MLAQIRNRLEQEKGRYNQIRQDLIAANNDLIVKRILGEIIETAQSIIQLVAQETQEQLSWKISELVTACLAAVFNDPYEFAVEFVQRRGKIECDFSLIRRGEKFDLLSSVGGGVAWVVALALRVALWNIQEEKPRPVLILDEPFHFIHSQELQERCSDLLKALSEDLGLQIIMVTGEDESPEMLKRADRIFRMEKRDDKTTMRRI